MDVKDMGPGMVLLGIGGGGCRLAVAVQQLYGAGMSVICADTDALNLREMESGNSVRVLLGGALLSGRGTGGDIVKGRMAAQADLDNLLQHMRQARTVVLVTTLGGGTGSGATPEIIKALHAQGVATICFATRPFTFEGSERRGQADRILPLLEESVDSLVTLSLDDLFAESGEQLLEEACRGAQQILAAGITLLWRLVTRPGFIQLDGEHLRKMLINGGSARFGYGVASGDNRAVRALAELKKCRLLRSGEPAGGARAVMLGILAGRDLLLAEVGEVVAGVKALYGAHCMLELGTVCDVVHTGRLELVVLAFEGISDATLSRKAWEHGTEAAVESREGAPNADSLVALAGVKSGRRKGRSKSSKLSHGATGRGRFSESEPTIFKDQDLDVPTYLRRRIVLDR